MELKEAIDTLKMLKRNLDFAVDIEAIETVLQALDNSISKDKIKEKIEELKKAYEDSKDEYGESPYYYPDYTIDKLEELLKGE
jgi:hypothetical protein